MITVEQQIESGEEQSIHLPVFTQGVFNFSLLAFKGAAIFLILSIAESTSSTILFFPTMIMTCFGPKIIEETLLPVLSILTIFPSLVMALLLDKK